MAAPAPVAGSHSTFAAGPEASRGQNGQTMLQVTSPNKATPTHRFAFGSGPVCFGVPSEETGQREITRCLTT
jgi:hypothetical protein